MSRSIHFRAPGARVCLQKGVEEYVVGITDANGDVTLDFVAETTGTIDVTVGADADAPNLVLSDASGTEDQAIALNIT